MTRTVYHIPGEQRHRVHRDADCHALENVETLTRAAPSDVPDRKRCSYCYGTDNGPDAIGEVPARVPCPCGKGDAVRTERPTADPDPHGRALFHFHFRHGPCGLGGTITAIDGKIQRRLGPVFDPQRYGGVGVGVSASD